MTFKTVSPCTPFHGDKRPSGRSAEAALSLRSGSSDEWLCTNLQTRTSCRHIHKSQSLEWRRLPRFRHTIGTAATILCFLWIITFLWTIFVNRHIQVNQGLETSVAAGGWCLQNSPSLNERSWLKQRTWAKWPRMLTHSLCIFGSGTKWLKAANITMWLAVANITKWLDVANVKVTLFIKVWLTIHKKQGSYIGVG